jgi:hypothetical protein
VSRISLRSSSNPLKSSSIRSFSTPESNNKPFKRDVDVEFDKRVDVIEFQTEMKPPEKPKIEDYFPHIAFERQVEREKLELKKEIEEHYRDRETPATEAEKARLTLLPNGLNTIPGAPDHHHDHHGDHGHSDLHHHDPKGDHSSHAAAGHHADHHGDAHAVGHDDHHHGHHHDDPHTHGVDLDHPPLDQQKGPGYSTLLEPFLVGVAVVAAVLMFPEERREEFKQTWNPWALMKPRYREPDPITDTRHLPYYIVPVAPPLFELEYYRDKIVRAELDGPFGQRLEEARNAVDRIRKRDKEAAKAAKEKRENSRASH